MASGATRRELLAEPESWALGAGLQGALCCTAAVDSITQATLGAVVADLGLGRRLGRGAPWWGVALGTLPDLDVLAYPFLDGVERLLWHRGPSHGLVILLALTPLCAWLVQRCHRQRSVAWWPCCWTVWLIFLTHVLIDYFTIYGTGVWEPFSDHRVASNNLFIIDPLFTLPLLCATLGAMLFPPERRWRWPLSLAAAVLATVYTSWSFTAKLLIEQRFAAQLTAEERVVDRWLSAPTPFNTLLWRCLAEGERDGEPGFWIGYASLLDDDPRVAWRWVPQQADGLGRWLHSRGAAGVRWFSQGWYVVRQHDGRPLMSDLRFGELTPFAPAIESVERPWIFNFHLDEDGHAFSTLSATAPRGAAVVDALWRRMLGWRPLLPELDDRSLTSKSAP